LIFLFEIELGNRLALALHAFELRGAPLDIKRVSTFSSGAFEEAKKFQDVLSVGSRAVKQMTGVPTSAYFLGHIDYAACSMIDMRRQFFGPFFSNPSGPGS
jgi:hypothetical protein